MTTTLVLEPPCAFINANDRLHFRKRNNLTQAWRDAAWAAGMQPRLRVHRTRVHVTVAIRFPDNRRRDVGNWYPTAKACIDGIVDAGLLVDDSDAYVIGPDMRREYPNGPARVTVTITPLEETP